MSSPVESSEDRQLVSVAGPAQRTRSLTHAVLLVCVAFLAGGGLGAVGLGVLESAGLTAESAPILTEIVPAALQFIGFFAVCGGYLAWREGDSLIVAALPTGHDIRWILLGFSGLVAALVGFELVLGLVGLAPAENAAVESGKENPRLFLYFIPVVLLLNSPAEELLFRGVVQGLFRRAYGVVPGVIAASVIFGAVHYIALVGEGSKIAYVGIAVISGLVLGALYEYTENLVVPIAAHACWNILVYVNLYLSTTGQL